MKAQYIEVKNKTTKSVKLIEVSPENAFKALRHYKRAWNVESARIITN